MKILFKNAIVIDLNCPNGFFNGCVEVTDNIITNVSHEIQGKDYDQIIDVDKNVLMPGFVNCHAHTPMTLLRSVKDDCNLQEWLYDNILPMESKLTNEDVYWGQMLGIAEYVKNGITAIEENYFCYDGLTRAINKSGIRARIGMGPQVNTNEKYDCYKDLTNIYNTIKQNTQDDLVNAVCYAHSIYALNEKKFYDLLKFANEHDLPLSIHLSETLQEVGECTQKYNGLTPPGFLEKIGFFDRQCLCYHCVHMDKDDLQILADYDVNVTTCPSSNIKLASGIAPIYAMQNKNLNITIGTDGPASNNCLDMFKEMFLVSALSKVSISDPTVVSALDVLKMATINGAKALNINSGEIAVGKNADIILVDIKKPHMQPSQNIISNLVYSANGNDVYFTMINGKIVYDNGKYNIGEDIQDIYNNANKIRNKLEEVK